jgi:putative transposase
MSDRTFFATSPSYMRQKLFLPRPMQELFIDVLRHYRREKLYRLHAFVLMPDHMHLLITPAETASLEDCMHRIKGSYSFRAKSELGKCHGVNGAGFNKERVKDADAYAAIVKYIHNNPVKRGLVASPEQYFCSSAWPGRRMDPNPFARAKAQK